MRTHNLLAAITAAFIFTSPLRAAAPADDKWPLQFDAETYDFGQIEEADGIVSHTFAFTNTSDSPVTIDYVTTSCGCTTASYPTEPIYPNQMCEFTVNFNPARTDGRVYRDIEIFVKGRKDCMRMELTATVTPAPIGIRQMYPHIIAGTVRTAFNNIAFGYIGQGHSVQKSAVLVNDGEQPVRLQAKTSKRNDMLVIECPPSLGAGTAESIVFTYTLPESGKYGTQIDTVWIWTDGVRGELPFVVSAICTDDFTKVSDKQPKLAVEPSYFDFGGQKAGKILKQKFVIRNEGNADLIVRAVEYSDGVTSDLSVNTAIKPKQSITITAAVAVRGLPGTKTSAFVNLITNDPVRPRRELRMTVEATR